MDFGSFEAIDTTKQRRIINAITGEFAKRGYKLASTNEMIREAQISKGLLFHYFHNKKAMFLYVYDYSLRMVREEILDRVDFTDTDVFNRFRHMAIRKLEIVQKFPQMYEFLLLANREPHDELTPDLEQRNTEYVNKFHERLLDNIDMTRFKDGVDVEKAIRIAFWTLEHFTSRHQDTWELRVTALQDVDIETVTHELDSYFDFLRQTFYRPSPK